MTDNVEDLWFSMDETELMTRAIVQKQTREAKNDETGLDDLLNKFITMGIPALSKYQNGLFAEAGDIKVCLSLEIAKDQEIILHVCSLGDGDKGLIQRLTFQSPHASLILKTFICDFPDAMFITPNSQILCLFTKVEENASTKISKNAKKLKHNSNAEGPMSFNTFARIVRDNIRKPKHIIVAVQN